MLEDIDKFWQDREPLLEVLDELRGPEAVGHVEADVDPDPGPVVGQLDDGYSRPFQGLETSGLGHMPESITEITEG